MKLKFYKLRAIFLIYFIKLLTKIFFVEMSPILSVAGLIERGGKLLFLDLSYSEGLGLPGGTVKGGESLEETLKREISEETGLKISKFEYFTSIKTVYKGTPKATAIFLVITSGNTKSSDEGKLVWMDPKEAIDRLHYEDNRKAIEKFLKKKI